MRRALAGYSGTIHPGFCRMGQQRLCSFSAQPVLRVVQDANDLQPRQVFLQHGLTIGSDSENTIRVDGDGIKPIHVRITEDGRGRLWAHSETARPFETLDGNTVWAMQLDPGDRFKIGRALFECAEVKLEEDCVETNEVKPKAEPAVPAAVPAPPIAIESAPKAETCSGEPADNDVSDDDVSIDAFCCSRCRSPIVQLPAMAKFCPRCGNSLPSDRPTLDALPPLPAPPPEHAANLLGWLLPLVHADFIQRPPAALHIDPHRPATLVAYINTLLHLGVRYESGIGGNYNLSQAMRYYRKAAKLGNELAQARVAIDAARDADSGQSKQ